MVLFILLLRWRRRKWYLDVPDDKLDKRTALARADHYYLTKDFQRCFDCCQALIDKGDGKDDTETCDMLLRSAMRIKRFDAAVVDLARDTLRHVIRFVLAVRAEFDRAAGPSGSGTGRHGSSIPF